MAKTKQLKKVGKLLKGIAEVDEQKLDNANISSGINQYKFKQGPYISWGKGPPLKKSQNIQY